MDTKHGTQAGDIVVDGDLVGDQNSYIKFGSDTWERGAASSNQALALGNGDALQGIPMLAQGKIVAISTTCENCDSTTNHIAMEARVNGVATTCDGDELYDTTANGNYSINSCSVSFSAGDRLGCYTKTETGAVTGLICHLAWQYD